MCWRGANGYMGYTGNEHPIVIGLIDQWNKLAGMTDFIGDDTGKPMPKHLKRLSNTINSVRNHLRNNNNPTK
jgi:hypothetical protein